MPGRIARQVIAPIRPHFDIVPGKGSPANMPIFRRAPRQKGDKPMDRSDIRHFIVFEWLDGAARLSTAQLLADLSAKRTGAEYVYVQNPAAPRGDNTGYPARPETVLTKWEMCCCWQRGKYQLVQILSRPALTRGKL